MTKKTKNDGSISVSGTGRVSVQPDVADLRLGVNVSRLTVDEARNDAAKTMAAILAAVAQQALPRRTCGRRFSPSSRATSTATTSRRALPATSWRTSSR